MTKQEFLAALSATKDQFEWQITASLQLRGWNEQFMFCPITAVILKQAGVYVPVDNVDRAQEYLEMSMYDIEIIVQTADDMQFGCNEILRNEMKFALGFD